MKLIINLDILRTAKNYVSSIPSQTMCAGIIFCTCTIWDEKEHLINYVNFWTFMWWHDGWTWDLQLSGEKEKMKFTVSGGHKDY